MSKNLLYKASIVTTPTAYGVGVLNSIKPALSYSDELVANGDFSVDTNGDGLADSWGETYGSEVTSIVTGNGHTGNAQRLGTPGSAYVAINTSSSVFTIGQNYQLSFNYRAFADGGTIDYGDGASGNTALTANTGNAINITRTYVGHNGSSLRFRLHNDCGLNAYIEVSDVSLKEVITADFDFTRSSSATRVNPEYLIETSAIDTPRLDYHNGTASILLEPQSTNLLTYSEDFSNAYWNKSASSVVSGQSAPDGTNNAFKFVEDSDNNNHAMYKNNISVSAGSSTLSFIAKAAERIYIELLDTETGGGVFFDLENGVIATVVGTPDSYSITPLVNGWYKISLTVTSVTKVDFQLYLSINGSSRTYQGDGTSGVYIFGVQLEQLSYATSYIPTSGTTQTRSTETLNNAGNSDLINSEEGVLYAEIAALADDGTDRRLSISDGTMNNYVSIGYSGFTGNIVAEMYSGGVLQTLGWGATGVTQTNNNKLALSSDQPVALEKSPLVTNSLL